MSVKLRDALFRPSVAGSLGEWFMACVLAGVVGLGIIGVIVMAFAVPGFGRGVLHLLTYLTVVMIVGMIITTFIRAVYLHFKRQKEVSK